MKTLLVTLLSIAIVGSTATGCATARTKWTDKTMRVMIDPEGVEANHYVKIQQALVESGKWVVVDRGMGYNAIQKEQEREHRNQTDRFLDREKFAHWGKLYGVGGVVVAHAQCQVKDGWFLKKNYPHCQQYLAVVDTNSGEVIAAVQDEADGGSYDYQLAPSWDDIVAKLNNAFPSHFQPNKDEKPLRDYKELSQEEATRQKEIVAKQSVRAPAEETQSKPAYVETPKAVEVPMTTKPTEAPTTPEVSKTSAPKAEAPKAEQPVTKKE